MSDQTRERVRQAAQDVGYVPNQLARNLKGNTSRTIGVLAGGTANQYYATLLGAFARALRDASFQALLADTMPGGVYDAERETTLVSSLLEQRVCAVLVTYALTPANLALIEDWQIPIVFVDCDLEHSAGHPAVAGDSEAAGRLVGSHFAEHGYRHWAFVGYPPRWSSRVPRERGFLDAASRHDASLDVVECGNDSDTAYHAMADYLRSAAARRVEALYCANTPILQGSLRAIADANRRVGLDLAVVGFDEFPWSDLLQPAITVIDQHIEEIGTTAAELLLDELRVGDRREPGEGAAARLIEPHLVVRESCGCHRASRATPL